MSRAQISSYHRPESLDEAWRHIADGDPSVRILSGGSDLTISAPPEVTALVDIARAVEGSIGVAPDGSIRLGAMATLTQIMDHPELAEYAAGVIPEMMIHVGSPLLRNFSTIGGHLARGRLSDIVPVFVALDAGVVIYRGREQSMPLTEYYGDRHHARPHILAAILLPALPERSAAAFARFARTAFDFPILNTCARVDLGSDGVDQVRIVCGATPQRARRATEAERWILEYGLDPTSIAAAAGAARHEVATGSNWVASAEYRSQLVEVLSRRCLTEVAERLEPA